MKKKRKRLAVIGIAVAAAVSLLAACGKTGQPSKELSVKEIMEKMEKNSEEIKSAKAAFDLTMDMGDGTESVKIGVNMDMDVTSEPEAVHGKGQVTFGASGTDMGMDMEMYTIEEGDQYVTYTNIQNQWQKEMQETNSAAGEMQELSGSIAEYAGMFQLKEGMTAVSGKECYELTGEIGGEMLSDLMQASGTDALSEYGMDEEALAELKMPCTVNIYKDSFLPARIYFDMAEAMSPMMEGTGITLNECYFDMSFKEYDTIDEIKVPQEVIDSAVESNGDLTLMQ